MAGGQKKLKVMILLLLFLVLIAFLVIAAHAIEVMIYVIPIFLGIVALYIIIKIIRLIVGNDK